MLLLLNLALTGYFFMRRGNHEAVRETKKAQESSLRYLKQKMGLTDGQERSLLLLRQEYGAKEEFLSDVIRAQRDSMNALMFSMHSDTMQLRLIAQRIAGNEFVMERLRIQQAEAFKALCTPEQVAIFREMVKPIRDFFQPDKKKP